MLFRSPVDYHCTYNEDASERDAYCGCISYPLIALTEYGVSLFPHIGSGIRPFSVGHWGWSVLAVGTGHQMCLPHLKKVALGFRGRRDRAGVLSTVLRTELAGDSFVSHLDPVHCYTLLLPSRILSRSPSYTSNTFLHLKKRRNQHLIIS